MDARHVTAAAREAFLPTRDDWLSRLQELMQARRGASVGYVPCDEDMHRLLSQMIRLQDRFRAMGSRSEDWANFAHERDEAARSLGTIVIGALHVANHLRVDLAQLIRTMSGVEQP
jgi:hypothetical protein